MPTDPKIQKQKEIENSQICGFRVFLSLQDVFKVFVSFFSFSKYATSTVFVPCLVSSLEKILAWRPAHLKPSTKHRKYRNSSVISKVFYITSYKSISGCSGVLSLTLDEIFYPSAMSSYNVNAPWYLLGKMSLHDTRRPKTLCLLEKVYYLQQTAKLLK